jgi:8-oxo-dGTP pyrophosphatase MutT (NUDIX family)
MSAPTTSGAEPSDVPIRDAACVLVVNGEAGEPKLLMGKRRAEQVFLPNKWVFPGGRVEDDDRALAARHTVPFSPPDLADAIRPFALAGIRELYEETGYALSVRRPLSGAGGAWAMFTGAGISPATANLSPLARAITPPGRVRRYDTWFFVADARDLSDAPALPDGELLELGWFTLSEARRLDLPVITRLVLDDFAALHGSAAQSRGDVRIPFYHSVNAAFRRELISCNVAPSTP